MYRAYITDALRTISKNTSASAQVCGAEGLYIEERYHNVIHPQKEETRTAEEVIEHVTSRLKGGVLHKRI